ncbi:MAG TPA: lysoplasmalogenase [Anaerolineales bacterium]|nr:lysoplasmalogenase [Anaerolineales bacterium]
MIPGLILFGVVAAIDWVAVARGWKRIEYLAKPGAMLVLLGMLGLVGRFRSAPVLCFGLGIFFSLAGDVFLMISFYRFSNRWFVPGLISFLLAHVAYIAGLNMPFPNVSPIWSLGVTLILALSAARILRRIIGGVRQKGLRRLVFPVGLYGLVITLMLLSALLTLYTPDWKSSAAGLVALGAILFYFSDILLAWNKFVNPIKNGRLSNMILYHLGQFALVAGVLIQINK